MPNVFIARHGETTWNLAGRYQGRRESELTPLGRAQACALADSLTRFEIDRVISSPLRRCLASAQPAADAFGLPIERDPLLIEIAHGRWEGRLRDDLAREDPERYCRWRHEPAIVQFEDGESVTDVLARWTQFVQTFEARGDTLLVTHDAVIRVALLERLGRDTSSFWQPRVQNGAYAWFSLEAGKWTLRSECVGDHLAGIAADPSVQAL